MNEVNYITDEVKALIGFEGKPVFSNPVERSEMRRFHHATMDPARRYWDEEWAAQSRYGGTVAAPTFPIVAFRREAWTEDPLDMLFEDPDAGGLAPVFRDLPPVPVPLTRRLNGGYRFSFYSYARIGEAITRVSRYKDIYQKNGRSGPLVFIVVEDVYSTITGERILDAVQKNILR